MKDAKKDKKPRPNLKNKDFVAWHRAETCRKEDNIVSTEWHEKLKKLDPFDPVYDNKPVNMVYLLCGEYGRLWQKERDEWYKNVFVPQPDQKDMEDRKRKVRQQAKEAKKAAQINAFERKQRRAKEIEAKAKADAEKLEKLKERVRKLAAPKLPVKTPKKKKETKVEAPPIAPTEEKSDTCPKGWKTVELTLQCECSDHYKDNSNEEGKTTQREPETSRTEASQQGCTMCEDYVQQMHDIHQAKCKENETSAETVGGQEKEVEGH